jgi:hypothetical protein
MATKQSCAACHHEEPRNCGECHQLQADLYLGGMLAGQDIPKDIMAEAGVSCQDCHISRENRVIRSTKNKCLDCHEEEYGELFTEWQGATQDLMRFIEASLKEKKKGKLNEQEKIQILNIQKTMEEIELDGSRGIHNFLFVEDILSRAKKTLQSLSSK